LKPAGAPLEVQVPPIVIQTIFDADLTPGSRYGHGLPVVSGHPNTGKPPVSGDSEE